jgi:hypothetical protein
MNRMGLAGAVGALTLALLVPASVSANGPGETWSAQIEKAKCTNVRGAHGFGKVVLQMRAFAQNDVVGRPTPNYIVITGWIQQKMDGIWVTGGVGSATTAVHPDGSPGVFEDLLGNSWNFQEADHPPTRLMMKVEFFDSLPTGDVRLGKMTGRTGVC